MTKLVLRFSSVFFLSVVGVKLSLTPKPSQQAAAESETFASAYEVTDFLGDGSVGLVQKCRAKNNHGGTAFACKKASRELLRGKNLSDQKIDRLFEDTEKEVALMKKLSTPGSGHSVAAVHDFFVEKRNGATISMDIVQDLYTAGDLNDALIEQNKRAREGFTPNEAVSIFRGLAKELTIMHTKGMMRRDFHPGNVMMHCPNKGNGSKLCNPSDREAHIIDFGTAYDFQCASGSCLVLPDSAAGSNLVYNPRKIEPKGYSLYHGPEVHKIRTPNGGKQPVLYSGKTDIWAAGMILVQLLLALPRFDKDKVCPKVGPCEELEHFKEQTRPRPTIDNTTSLENLHGHFVDSRTQEIIRNLSTPGKKLVKGLFTANPNLRYTAEKMARDVECWARELGLNADETVADVNDCRGSDFKPVSPSMATVQLTTGTSFLKQRKQPDGRLVLQK